MADRVDFDAVLSRYEAAMWFNAAGPPEAMRTVLSSVEDVPDLLAELKVAREVVEAARYADADAPDPWRMSSAAMNELRAAISSYDQHADPSTHDRSGGS